MLQEEHWSQRVQRLAEHDIRAPRQEYVCAPPQALRKRLLRLLVDSRDEPLLFLLLNVACSSLPAGLALITGVLPQSHTIGGLYFGLTYGLYLQRFILSLHYSEHRPIFTKEYGFLNRLPSLVLAPLFGIPPGMYRLHHCAMHHTEDNLFPADLSSTEPYHRDSLLHFLAYWARFAVCTWVELPWYALTRRRYALAAECLLGEAAYFGGAYCLWAARPVAALWVFVVPYVASSLALMFGNWSQHMFVDARDPRDDYRLTYNCLAAPDNAKTFNDGYHAVHHANSRVHWADMPAKFLSSLARHAASDALVFQGLHFFDVGVAVFSRRWGVLADALVPLSDRAAAMSREERIAMLKARCRPVTRDERGPHLDQLAADPRADGAS